MRKSKTANPTTNDAPAEPWAPQPYRIAITKAVLAAWRKAIVETPDVSVVDCLKPLLGKQAFTYAMLPEKFVSGLRLREVVLKKSRQEIADWIKSRVETTE